VVNRRDAEPRPAPASERVRGLPSGRSGDRGRSSAEPSLALQARVFVFRDSPAQPSAVAQ
jgi:hypothetical protein